MTAPDPTDWPRVMQAAQDGDHRAYATLLSAVVPWLRRHLGAMLSDPAAVEDVVQDTLLSLHAARHTYDPSRPLKPWLVALLRARAIDHLRRRARRVARVRTLEPDDETIADPTANREDESVLHAVPALARAIASLPPGQRRAVTLLKLKEMSLREAAELTGQSVTALKVATHRAMARLRLLLGEAQ